MSEWKTLLHADPTDWLLEDSHPSVRYFTLRWLLDRPDSDPEVVLAAQAIAESGPIRKLLASQRPEGYWGSDPRPHHGTKRYLRILQWLGYPGENGVRTSMEYLITGCLQEDGAYGIELKGRLVKLPCHGGGLLSLMLWSGYARDPRTQNLLAWLVSTQGEDGIWPCISKLRPFSCLWASVDILRSYRDLPDYLLTADIEASRQLAIEQILDSSLYRYGKGKTSPRWFEFGFPLRFDTDILEVLELLAPYVTPDEERIQEGLSLVLGKQTPEGRWLCEKHPKGGRWMQKYFDFEAIGQPSKWVTLHALRMLKTLHAGSPV